MVSEAEVCAAALAGLPGIGPARLAAVLADRDPVTAWKDVRSGRLRAPARGRRPVGGRPAGHGAGTIGDDAWSAASARVDLAAVARRMSSAGIRATWAGRPEWPEALRHDPEPPAVLFWCGDPGLLDQPTVAVVGTRNCTPDGAAVAFELGRDLVRAGVSVISGLALGIDGAAHAGVLEGRRLGPARPSAVPGSLGGPVGVAASGVDVAYPARHRALWRRVAGEGLLLSEAPPGVAPQAWRFPTRNRIIAALSRLVVIVESHVTGGSLITADAAIARGIDVRVVPGSVRSPASTGSNRLLRDGPGPVSDARDVLDALGFVLPTGPAAPGGGRARRGDDPVDPVLAAVRDVLGSVPRSLGELVALSGRSVAEVSAALERLAGSGGAHRQGDWWSRATGAPSG